MKGSRNVLCSVFGIPVLAALSVIPCRAANIITFANAPQSCGSAVLCSSTSGPLPAGTQGYVTTGSTAFNLSTITQWFQIDPDGVSHLANQPAEPDGGAGGFLVVNDTGQSITSFSLTLTDTFTSTTASVAPCKSGGPEAGQLCDNFQAHGGSLYPWNTELSGSTWNDCTQGSTVGNTCQGAAGGAAGDFAPNSVTYSWSTLTPGQAIAAGAKFVISFASWNNDVFASGGNAGGSSSPVPEPGSIVLLGSILILTATRLRKRTPTRP